MRAFISLNLSCTDSISRLFNDLNSLKIRTVNPDQLHITLKFLGDVDEPLIEKIKTVVDEACNDFHSFDFSFTDIGIFPRKDGSGIVWIGSDSKEVPIISKSLDERLSKIGIPKETKPFVNHVTIARPKYNIKQIAKCLDGKNYVFDKQWVDSIFLMSSILTPRGPIYKIEKKSSLQMRSL